MLPTCKSLRVNIHPLQCVVILLFEMQFDLISAVSPGAGEEIWSVTATNTAIYLILQDSRVNRGRVGELLQVGGCECY